MITPQPREVVSNLYFGNLYVIFLGEVSGYNTSYCESTSMKQCASGGKIRIVGLPMCNAFDMHGTRARSVL